MPVEIFISYSHRDEPLREELTRHLALLQRRGYVSAWHDRRIAPGDDWGQTIDAHLESARIILLLISADFLASGYCYDVEMKRALERHAAGEAVVVPILLRPVDWEGAPFARLQALPTGARPITTWPDRDAAFADVAAALRQLVTRRFLDAAPVPVDGGPAPRPQVPSEQDRILDAALAREVVVGHPTELLAFVRRSSSAGLAELLAVEKEDASPEDVRSRTFRLEFPVDASGAPAPATVDITLASPEFQPPTQTKTLRVPPDGDSVIARFLLVPTCTGELTVSVELAVGELHQATRALRTRAEAGDRQVVFGGMGIVSIPLPTTARLEAPTPPRSRSTRSSRIALGGGMAAAAALLIVFNPWRQVTAPPKLAMKGPPGTHVAEALMAANRDMQAGAYESALSRLKAPIVELEARKASKQLSQEATEQLADAWELTARANLALGRTEQAAQSVARLQETFAESVKVSPARLELIRVVRNRHPGNVAAPP